MAAEENEEESDLAKPDKPARGSSKLLKIGIIVSIAAVAGIAFFLVSAGQKPEKLVQEEPDEHLVMIEDPDNVLTGALLPLGSFTVNLGAPDTFLKTSVSVEFFDFELTPELQAKVPKFRNTVIELISAKRPEDLLSDTGKSRFRLELVNALNQESSESAKVVNVYFTDFVVQ